VTRSPGEIVRTAALLLAVLAGAGRGTPAGAQEREIQRYRIDTPEGRLMGFYSAALALTSFGGHLTSAGESNGIMLALEISYVPYLDREQRTAAFDKPESSNLSPFLPRPHVVIGLPGHLRLDATWLPPIEVQSARANLYGASLSRAFMVGATVMVPRLAYQGGRVEGPITCSEDLGEGTSDEQIYFANVCHARKSNDYFDPVHLSFDLTIATPGHIRGLRPYVSLGVRHEDIRFDIGVSDSDLPRDPDHPILEMTATRPYATVGIDWRPGKRERLTTELFYAPGSLLTVRALVGVRIE
jgi:hypothetical protein